MVCLLAHACKMVAYPHACTCAPMQAHGQAHAKPMRLPHAAPLLHTTTHRTPHTTTHHTHQAVSELSIADNQLSSLPSDLSGWKGLQKLHLYGNRLEELPVDSLMGLPALQQVRFACALFKGALCCCLRPGWGGWGALALLQQPLCSFSLPSQPPMLTRSLKTTLAPNSKTAPTALARRQPPQHLDRLGAAAADR